MSESEAVYHTDNDGGVPPEIARDPQFVARLDNAALHAWVTAATALLQELLTASAYPADWPRDQAWQPTVQLYPTYRTRITALLAGPLPPDPLVGEVNRLCGLLDTVQTERALLRSTLAETQAEVTRLQKELTTIRSQRNRISATLSDERMATAKAAMRTDAAAPPTPAVVKGK